MMQINDDVLQTWYEEEVGRGYKTNSFFIKNQITILFDFDAATPVLYSNNSYLVHNTFSKYQRQVMRLLLNIEMPVWYHYKLYQALENGTKIYVRVEHTIYECRPYHMSQPKGNSASVYPGTQPSWMSLELFEIMLVERADPTWFRVLAKIASQANKAEDN